MNNKTIYVTYTNTDLCEGRGNHIPIFVCESESTAIRLGVGMYVQGTNCPVNEVTAIDVGGEWFIPISAVRVQPPTDADKKSDAKKEAISKARKLGLDEASIQALM
jgi:hypothetical protein